MVRIHDGHGNAEGSVRRCVTLSQSSHAHHPPVPLSRFPVAEGPCWLQKLGIQHVVIKLPGLVV